LLGSVQSSFVSTIDWQETLVYVVQPLRLITKQALIKGEILGKGNRPIASATFGVAVVAHQ
jgi:hypothetical protein